MGLEIQFNRWNLQYKIEQKMSHEKGLMRTYFLDSNQAHLMILFMRIFKRLMMILDCFSAELHILPIYLKADHHAQLYRGSLYKTSFYIHRYL